MDFFVQAVNVLKILVMAVGAGLGAWVLSILWRDMVMITLAQNLRASNSLWLVEVLF